MIYFSFKNYDEFKEQFGVQEHGNGVKSRKNKILLSLLKNKAYLHKIASAKTCYTTFREYRYVETLNSDREFKRWYACTEFPFGVNLLECRNLTELREKLYAIMWDMRKSFSLRLNGRYFWSDVFGTDDFGGVCEDGDESSIRYVNHDRDERVFKMKAGKFFRKLVEEIDGLDSIISEQVKIWLCEQFAEEWKAYASQFSNEYDLHVDENFSDIYSNYYLDGNFKSCMVGRGFDDFYSDAVNAKAAYLTKKGALGEHNSIVARCIIFPEVHVYGSDQILRLAERQYATDGSDKLKRQLVMALIEAGEIDGYKKVGADCGDSRGFVDIHGNALPSTDLWIECNVDGCSVSYQDSFKYYSESNERAYNCSCHSHDYDLAITDGSLEDNHDDDSWSEYNDEWISNDEADYVETREDYFYYNQVVEAHVNGSRYTEWCFEEDCIEIKGEYYYAGDDAAYPNENGIYECPRCGEYFVGEDGYYSELTEEDYCCESCLEEAEDDYRRDNGWAYSEYDNEWYEDGTEVLMATRWVQRYSWKDDCFMGRYENITIHIETLNGLIEDGEATYVNGIAYIDDIGFDGEPVHIAAADLRAA